MSIKFLFVNTTLAGATPTRIVPLAMLNPPNDANGTFFVRSASVQLKSTSASALVTLTHLDSVTPTDGVEIAKGVSQPLAGGGHADTKNSESFDLARFRVTGANTDAIAVIYEPSRTFNP